MAGVCGDRRSEFHVAFLLHGAAGNKRKTKEINEIGRHPIAIKAMKTNHIPRAL